MSTAIRVTVWNEGVHEKRDETVRRLYPEGLGRQIASYLERQPGIASVHVSELDHPGQGLTEDLVNATDVMVWWGHMAHAEVADEHVARVRHRVVQEGMGLVVLHSGHHSKVFRGLMGTSCDLKWREIGERERLWVVDPAHPIADGLGEYFELPATEMYGEHFDIPQPDQLVFISWFQGGEVFRSGCCWHRGRGKVFYFRPGHETLPIYHDANVLAVIRNGVYWARPGGVTEVVRGHRPEPLEAVPPRQA